MAHSSVSQTARSVLGAGGPPAGRTESQGWSGLFLRSGVDSGLNCFHVSRNRRFCWRLIFVAGLPRRAQRRRVNNIFALGEVSTYWLFNAVGGVDVLIGLQLGRAAADLVTDVPGDRGISLGVSLCWRADRQYPPALTDPAAAEGLDDGNLLTDCL